jgi:hypothetical protein
LHAGLAATIRRAAPVCYDLRVSGAPHGDAPVLLFGKGQIFD